MSLRRFPARSAARQPNSGFDLQLRQNRTLMRAQVRHELTSTIVDLLNSSADNSQLAGVLRRGALGEELTLSGSWLTIRRWRTAALITE